MTNWELKAYYLHFNKKYFSNRLPKDMPVCFADWSKKNVIGRTHFLEERPCSVRIHKKMKAYGLSNAALITLLHEMCHLKLGRSVNCQGVRGSKPFKKEFRRLVKAGAFDRLF